MSQDTATLAALILIVVAIGVRVMTGSLLLDRKKALTDILAQLRATRVELEFARERKKAAEDVVHFAERQKMDLQRQIEKTKEDLKILAEAGGKEDGGHEVKAARSLGRRSSDD